MGCGPSSINQNANFTKSEEKIALLKDSNQIVPYEDSSTDERISKGSGDFQDNLLTTVFTRTNISPHHYTLESDICPSNTNTTTSNTINIPMNQTNQNEPMKFLSNKNEPIKILSNRINSNEIILKSHDSISQENCTDIEREFLLDNGFDLLDNDEDMIGQDTSSSTNDDDDDNSGCINRFRMSFSPGRFVSENDAQIYMISSRRITDRHTPESLLRNSEESHEIEITESLVESNPLLDVRGNGDDNGINHSHAQ